MTYHRVGSKSTTTGATRGTITGTRPEFIAGDFRIGGCYDECGAFATLFRHIVTVWMLIWWHLLLCEPPQVEDFLRIALNSL